jgi:hypothetical protein
VNRALGISKKEEYLKISISRDVMLCSLMFSDVPGDHATFILYPISIGFENCKSHAKKNFPNPFKTETRFVYPFLADLYLTL